MASENCGNCRFLHNGETMTCRRFPPTVSIEMISGVTISGQTTNEYEPISYNPKITTSYWCGEFQPKEHPNE